MAWRARIILQASGKGEPPLSERLSLRVPAAYRPHMVTLSAPIRKRLTINWEFVASRLSRGALCGQALPYAACTRLKREGAGCTSSIPPPNQDSSPGSSPADRPFLGRRPARRRASRRIHSIWALEERISSAAQRSTAAQISGSMRNGYCFRAAIGHSPSCRANRC